MTGVGGHGELISFGRILNASYPKAARVGWYPPEEEELQFSSRGSWTHRETGIAPLSAKPKIMNATHE